MKRLSMPFVWLMAALLIGASGPLARAWADEATQRACQGDMQKLCSSIPPGHGNIFNCLQQHQAELSPDCQSRMAQKKQWMQENQAQANPCIADKEKFCQSVEGHEAIMNCLQQHQAGLSPDCQNKMTRMAQRMQENREKMQACMADKEKFCRDVQPGEGRIINCLMQHQADLSPDCQSRMAQKKQGQENR